MTNNQRLDCITDKKTLEMAKDLGYIGEEKKEHVDIWLKGQGYKLVMELNSMDAHSNMVLDFFMCKIVAKSKDEMIWKNEFEFEDTK